MSAFAHWRRTGRVGRQVFARFRRTKRLLMWARFCVAKGLGVHSCERLCVLQMPKVRVDFSSFAHRRRTELMRQRLRVADELSMYCVNLSPYAQY